MNKQKSAEVKRVGGNDPLPMERQEKLKIFAMVSVHKDHAEEYKARAMNKKICLSLSAAYSFLEAMEAAKFGIRDMGIVPDDYLIAVQNIAVNAEDIIAMPATIAQVVMPEEGKSLKSAQKSKEDMVAYVRYIFDAVGTTSDKKLAEEVITKFLSKKK